MKDKCRCNEPATAAAAPVTPGPQRMFVVYQKGKGGTTVYAETCQITDSGVLIFRNGSDLIMAFSPGGWTFMEEGEADD